MPALFVIQADLSADATLSARYREYQVQVGPLIEAHGCLFRASGIGLEVLEGAHDGRRLIVFEFPSMASLRAFWESPEYAALKDLRADAARIDAWALPAQ